MAQNDLTKPEVEVPEQPEDASNVVSLYSGLSSANLQKKVDKMTKQRGIIADFVKQHLKDGVDYGTIQSTSASGKSFKSKPTLYKPGQEKIFSLFGLVSELEKDTETLEMLNSVDNLVAYKCNVYKNGVKVAEGRGAAVIGDLKRDANSTIKIAEKRARMDACLSLGFSEYFTQDLEDPEYRNTASQNGNGNGASAPAKEVTDNPASEAQIKLIYGTLERKGFSRAQADQILTGLTGLEGMDKLTKRQASDTIDKLFKASEEELFDYLPETEDSGVDRSFVPDDIPPPDDIDVQENRDDQ